MKRTIISLLLFFASQFVGTFFATLFMLLPELKDSASAITDFAASIQLVQQLISDNMIMITLWGLIIGDLLLLPFFWLIKYCKPADLVKPVDGKLMIMAIIFIITADFSINYFSSGIELENNLEEMFVKMSQSWWGLVAMGLLGPVVEETVFRRIMIDSLWTRFGKPWLAIAVSAFLFGLIHMNPAQSFFATLIGIVYGWVYVRTGSMFPGVLAHVINNSVGVIQMMKVGEEALTEMDSSAINPVTMTIMTVFAIVAFFMWRKIGPMPEELRHSRDLQ